MLAKFEKCWFSYAFIYVQKEQENDPAVFTELEKSSENYHEDPKLFEEVTYESIESDFAQLPSDCGQELALLRS